ncbi:sodium/calcium exchanger family protein/calcium-binding EF hand family protein [Abeliophyllum distichum]|uniref:Sodium/calcium exchanger family protein/calcium-binding EF hand family protein n=1 Tax=Abeliophyllum distichum TaxID=126358 RepID=A0ABD1PTW0_9LAMI
MASFVAKTFYLLLFLSVPVAISSRSFPGTSSDELVSDGSGKAETVIRFKGMDSGAGEECVQMYGFLPCSKNIPGHLFLILVYEYLLFHGESYVASGGERIFKILGPGIFGACAFQVIGSLPEALILLASGLLSSKDVAEECVLTGVGLVAGSTILLLTVLWGTCVILANQDFSNQLKPNPSSSSKRRKLNPLERFLTPLWPGYGVVTDMWTCYTAGIMLLSVIPLAMIQIPKIFQLSYVGERICILITLVVSIIFLISYFFYQIFQPWIQKRRLLYIKHEHLVIDILKHVQNQTMGRVLTDNGSPNLLAIRRLFEETDHDGDKFISLSELKEFLQEIRFRELDSDKDKVTEDIMKEFDVDDDKKITMDEFVNGMTKWVDESKGAVNKRYHSIKSLKNLYQVIKPWIQKKREERDVMKHLVPKILEHLENSIHGNLLTDDGAPDIPDIRRLFKDIDKDNNDFISCTELKDRMNNMKPGVVTFDLDAVASKMMEELDISGDQLISEDEFDTGLSKWLNTTYNQNPDSEDSEEIIYEKTWEQTDKLVENQFIDKSAFAWFKAIALVVLGIVTLGLLAEPLIDSVRNFSSSANTPSFFFAFILVPMATNSRIAISAISEARKKKLHITSLTFSEIYGVAFMNNTLGLAVLLSLVYIRGLSWNYSVEVLMVLVVSTIMGCLASFTTIIPVWTSFLAFLLYPLSLILVYVFGDFNWLS